MFADLKNDFVFRRIFAQHPMLTAALLNELLTLEGDERIVELALLPPEQAPVVAGAKLSILDLKARDQGGRTYVVEMQLLPVKGFLNRIVYNACKAYVGQLPQARGYRQLQDVMAVSVCDFELWPAAAGPATPVPLVSRWALTEEASGTQDLRQVQYVFVELPKVPKEGLLTRAAERWAWLFKYGEQLKAVPAGLTAAQAQALELANEATFTAEEAEAYRKVEDEIEQARQLAEDAEERGEVRGEARGEARGEILGKAAGLREAMVGLREAIVDVCELLGVELTKQRRAQLDAMEWEALQALRQHLKQHRTWLT